MQEWPSLFVPHGCVGWSPWKQPSNHSKLNSIQTVKMVTMNIFRTRGMECKNGLHCLFHIMVMFMSVVAMQPSPVPPPVLGQPVPSSLTPTANCSVPVTCVPIVTPICLGQKLPYTLTKFGLVSDSETEADAQQKLLLWSGLQNVPRCWEVIQPLLCATYMPRLALPVNVIQ